MYYETYLVARVCCTLYDRSSPMPAAYNAFPYNLIPATGVETPESRNPRPKLPQGLTMRIRHLLHAAAAALAFLSLPATAQNCAVVPASPGLVGGPAFAGFAGFTDVLASNQFCPEVEWVRNRGITLGCGAGTAYCPNDPVTRLQMAIFLKRQGDKLTPTIIEPVPQSDSVTQLDLSPPGGVVRCQTGEFVIAADSYPRRAHFTGRINLYNPTVSGGVVTDMVYTVTDPGQPASTTWLAVPITAHFLTMYSGAAFVPSHDVSTYPNGYLDLAANKSYKFGMRVQRQTGSLTNVAVNCTNIVSIASRSSATRPFDGAEYMPPADAAPPQGRPYP
jgi:hypothetical protein